MFKIFFRLLLVFNREHMHQENGGLMPLYLNTMDVAAPQADAPVAIWV
jgi:hypothetical protein